MTARLYHLADRRPFPRHRFLPTVNGTVILTSGPGADTVEDHLDVRAARALLNELADSIDMAEFLARGRA